MHGSSVGTQLWAARRMIRCGRTHRILRGTQSHVHDRTVFGDVDMLSSCHVSDLALQISRVRQGVKQSHGFTSDPLAGVVKAQAIKLSHKPRAPIGILQTCREEAAGRCHVMRAQRRSDR